MFHKFSNFTPLPRRKRELTVGGRVQSPRTSAIPSPRRLRPTSARGKTFSVKRTLRLAEDKRSYALYSLMCFCCLNSFCLETRYFDMVYKCLKTKSSKQKTYRSETQVIIIISKRGIIIRVRVVGGSNIVLKVVESMVVCSWWECSFKWLGWACC